MEVGEYDISGPNEMMSTKEMKVIFTIISKEMMLETNLCILKGETRGGAQGLQGPHL